MWGKKLGWERKEEGQIQESLLYKRLFVSESQVWSLLQFRASHGNQTSKVLEVNFCFACFPLEIVRRPALYDVQQVQVAFSSWPSVLPPSMYSPWRTGGWGSGTDGGDIKCRRNCDPPHRVHVLIKHGPYWGYIWGWRWTNPVSHFVFFPGVRKMRWDEMRPLFTYLRVRKGNTCLPVTMIYWEKLWS